MLLSTILPTAIARPPRVKMLIVTSKAYIRRKAMTMLMGMDTVTIKEARTAHKNMTIIIPARTTPMMAFRVRSLMLLLM